ncbi:unnamed protein product [Nezara viridula]|uniref:Uncharacterized protein n=1 Tax=Nezara viridula TaxID=85310 RepID=A0A9P0HGV3_NEZVI|nr:unnamed protein product [Nezara viridula]
MQKTPDQKMEFDGCNTKHRLDSRRRTTPDHHIQFIISSERHSLSKLLEGESLRRSMSGEDSPGDACEVEQPVGGAWKKCPGLARTR